MSAPSENFILEHSLPGQRLDSFLRARFTDVSRGTIQRLIEEGHIRVNDRVVKPTHQPRAGETVSVVWPEAQPSEAQPENIALQILFEDKSLLVLNKAPGIVVHPAAGHDAGTLVNALLHHCAGELSGIGGVARPGIVHRLDKETSGCLVVAKNDLTHLALAEQFGARTVKKIYHTILCGEVPRAYVALNPGAVADAASLRDWLNERVCKHERVDAVVIRHALPKTMIGKLDRKALRAEALGV